MRHNSYLDVQMNENFEEWPNCLKHCLCKGAIEKNMDRGECHGIKRKELHEIREK